MYFCIGCMKCRYISVLPTFRLHLNNDHCPKSESLFDGFPQEKVLARDKKEHKQYLTHNYVKYSG